MRRDYRQGRSNNLLTGLISSWELNETSGTAANDATGVNNLTTENAVKDQTGIDGSAYKCTLSPVTKLYKTNPTGLNNLSNGSISMWFKWNVGTAGNAVLFMAGNSSYSYRFMWIIIGSAQGKFSDETIEFSVGFYTDSVPFQLNMVVRRGTYLLRDGAWHHIVVAIGGSQATDKIYLDGAEQTIYWDCSYDYARFTNFGYDITDLYLGSRRINVGGTIYEGCNLDGYIDQTRIWNRCLTASEVSLLYNNGNGLSFDMLQ